MIAKIAQGQLTDENTIRTLEDVPMKYLICVLNDIPNAYEKLLESKPILKTLKDESSYIKYKEAVRVLRKIKYQ